VWFKHRAWIPVAWGLAVVNVAAVWFAARPGEPIHATLHALLAVGCALGAQRLAARQRGGDQHEQLQQTLEQNHQLQQNVDDMQARLLELEERQDFAERILAQHRDPQRSGEPPA
jgi:hypothetical protein